MLSTINLADPITIASTVITLVNIIIRIRRMQQGQKPNSSFSLRLSADMMLKDKVVKLSVQKTRHDFGLAIGVVKNEKQVSIMK